MLVGYLSEKNTNFVAQNLFEDNYNKIYEYRNIYFTNRNLCRREPLR